MDSSGLGIRDGTLLEQYFRIGHMAAINPIVLRLSMPHSLFELPNPTIAPQGSVRFLLSESGRLVLLILPLNIKLLLPVFPARSA